MTDRSQRWVESAIASRLAGLCAVGLLIVACGQGTKQPSSAPTGLEQSDVAGGETSEFSGGDISYCPEAGATFVPLGLESEELEPWVAMVQGEYDTTLEWQPGLVGDAGSDAVTRTRLQLDIDVVSAQDVVFGATPGYEAERCEGTRELRLLLAVALRTADGALSGSFQHWVSPAKNAQLLTTTAMRGNAIYSSADFASAAGLVLEPGSELRFSLELAAGSLRGVLTFEPAGSSCSVRGAFPDGQGSPRLYLGPLSRGPRSPVTLCE
ncbi:MAG: hypothetical protein ABW217_23890 [Polyangiaceae bacterium]